MFFGSMEEVLKDCCGCCPPVPDELIEEERDIYVSGPLTFIEDNPGRQEIGSFHPITDDDWSKGAMVPDDLAGLLSSILMNDTRAIDEILSRGTLDINDRDWVGYVSCLLYCCIVCYCLLNSSMKLSSQPLTYYCYTILCITLPGI